MKWKVKVNKLIVLKYTTNILILLDEYIYIYIYYTTLIRRVSQHTLNKYNKTLYESNNIDITWVCPHID